MAERLAKQSGSQQFSGEQEVRALPTFIETSATGHPARCVDGREAPDSSQGKQLLGGSIGLVVVDAIAHQRPLNQDVVTDTLQRLSDSGHITGGHRGSNKNEERKTCDCGFCDQLPVIVGMAQSKRDVISSRLRPVYEGLSYVKELGTADVFDRAYDLLSGYQVENIEVKGEHLLSVAENEGAIVETVQGDHAERVAFVNFKRETTLDTQALNSKGDQGFNLDLWAVEDLTELWKNDYTLQTKGIDINVAKAITLILYQATEIVLVEEKGEPALPVVINE